jgi:hypothetical protein
MLIRVRNRCSDFNSYRAARVKSLFNAENGCNFDLDASLDIDDGEWQLGVVVGPSGSGKTSIGRQLFAAGEAAFWQPEWPPGEPIVDTVAAAGDFDAVTGALAAVRLGSVPCWLRPYQALSNGERFRADLARLACEQPAEAVVDEFHQRRRPADRAVWRARLCQGLAPHKRLQGGVADAALRRHRLARARLAARHGAQ